jgi:hypothetical protein
MTIFSASSGNGCLGFIRRSAHPNIALLVCLTGMAFQVRRLTCHTYSREAAAERNQRRPILAMGSF